MQINFGLDIRQMQQGKNRPVCWNSARVVNGHTLLVGMSGSGKTHTLRNMISQMQASATAPVRFHVFDVHGDINLKDACSVMISEQTPYGLNPLRLNPDPHFGGIRKRIQSFITILGRSHALGAKQEAVIRNILQDLYEWRRFYADKPGSWKEDAAQKHTYPTVEDAYKVAHYILKTRFLGADQASVKTLQDVNRKALALQKRYRAAKTDPNDLEELEQAKEKAIEAYIKYVSSISSGTELDDLIKYNSVTVLSSVVERLANLRANGIFKNSPLPLVHDASIWRYDLRALARPEQVLFTLFRLEELFEQARQRGEQDHIRDVIILDEARIYANDDPANPINSISTEGRKFGLSLICASQSPTHFPENFIASVATKIILGIDEMYWDGAIKRMAVTREQLKWITPQRSCIIQIKEPGETRSSWQGTILMS